jgi:hypothetical protein
VQRRIDRREDTFIYQRSIGQVTYDRQYGTLREEMALVEIELHWLKVSLDQRQRLQQAFFSEGLRFDGAAF